MAKDINDFVLGNARKISKEVAVKNTVDISAVSGLSEDLDKKVRISWRSKPIDTWNQQDIVNFFYGKFRDKFGKFLINGRPPYAICYQAIADTRLMLEKGLGLKDECPLTTLKEYYDFCYEDAVNDIISKKKTPLSMHDFKNERLVLEFVKKQNQLHIPIIVVEQKSKLQLDDVNDAFGIHSQYFVENYGVIIPVNYLIHIKKKSKEDAILYVKKALNKVSAKIKTQIESVTMSFAPYPKWMSFLELNEFFEGQLVICDDNPVFEFLRS